MHFEVLTLLIIGDVVLLFHSLSSCNFRGNRAVMFRFILSMSRKPSRFTFRLKFVIVFSVPCIIYPLSTDNLPFLQPLFMLCNFLGLLVYLYLNSALYVMVCLGLSFSGAMRLGLYVSAFVCVCSSCVCSATLRTK